MGNNSCVIAVARRRGIDILQNESGNRKTASMVGFNGNQRAIGDEAEAQYSTNFKNTITNLKRFVGRTFNDPIVQSEIPLVPFKVVAGPNGETCFEVKYNNMTETLESVQVTAALLQKLKTVAEAGLDGQRVSDCVIACPPFWTDAQRQGLLHAARIAGLNVLRLMNETTAVALSYGILRPLPEDEARKVCFVDVGHTNTHATVVSFVKGKLEVLGTASNPNVGARNFDVILAEYFANFIKEKYKMDVMTNGKAKLKLFKECGRIKKILSANLEAPFNVEYIMNDTDVHGSINRDQFEEASQQFLPQLLDAVQRALDMSGVSKEELFDVEVVGGGIRIPCVQKTLEDFFGKKLSKTCDGDDSVARGCALQCAMLSPNFKVRDFEVKDISLYPIEVAWGSQGGEEEASSDLFTVKNAMPSVKLISFKDRDDALQIVVRYKNDDSLPEATNPIIGTWIVSGIPKPDPNAEKAPKIKVKLRMDLNNLVSVSSAHLHKEVLVEEEVKKEEPAPAAENAMETEPAADGAETPKEDGAATPEAADSSAMETESDATAAAEETKPEPKFKKVVRKFPLVIEAHPTNGWTEEEFNAHFEKEAQFFAQDRLVAETDMKRNELESYVLEIRGAIQDALGEYETEDVKAAFLETLMTTEDWLYDEGFDAQKSEFVNRIQELRKVGDPIQQRAFEAMNRENAVQKLKSVIGKYQTAASSEDEKYSHIEAEERAKVATLCTETDAWLAESLSKMDRQAKHENPLVTCSQLDAKKNEIESTCGAIMNKPKPAPKPEAKPEEPKAEVSPEDAPKDQDGDVDMDDASTKDEDSSAMEVEEPSA